MDGRKEGERGRESGWEGRKVKGNKGPNRWERRKLTRKRKE